MSHLTFARGPRLFGIYHAVQPQMRDTLQPVPASGCLPRVSQLETI